MIISTKAGGLGNRLKYWVSAMRLAVLPGDESHLPAGFSTAGAGAHPVIRGLEKMWLRFRGKPDDQIKKIRQKCLP